MKNKILTIISVIVVIIILFLARTIYSDHNLKKIIKIIHPEIRFNMNNFVKKYKHKKFVILDIPLLMENKIKRLVIRDCHQNLGWDC